MTQSRFIELLFFYGVLAFAFYMAFLIAAPFITTLLVVSIIVVVFYPWYEFLRQSVFRKRDTLAAGSATLLVIVTVMVPLIFITNLVLSELSQLYTRYESGEISSLKNTVQFLESRLAILAPNASFDIQAQFSNLASWAGKHAGTLVSGTISLFFTLFFSVFALFYLFRDGRKFLHWLVVLSPLNDARDELILQKIGTAIRGVVSGTLFLAMLQGSVAALGFWLFGVEQAALLGTLAAFGSALPGIGLAGVMLPVVAFLFFTSTTTAATGLLIWALIAIVVTDNIIGPMLMSRGNNLHPFVVLTSVLGGVALVGPIGFILGPVSITFLLVLLDIYTSMNKPLPVPKKQKK